MNNFPDNFIYGKNIWIWNLVDCLGGSIPAIIQKCKDNNINTVIVKCADGSDTWPQWTQELVDQFKQSGLKILAWSYCYGKDPQREADIALWALDMDADGFVIDAESEYENLPNPGQAATVMMQTIRAKYPNAFIAYAPFPVIDYHEKYPYLEFGKYCSAVMPQLYYVDFEMTPNEALSWMFSQWEKWEQSWKDGGFADSIKPIIPIASFYDDAETKPPYTLNPADIEEFISGAAGYKSVSIWEFAHIFRPDCWDAIKNTNVDAPSVDNTSQNNAQNQPQAPNSTPSTPAPAFNQNGTTMTPAQVPAAPIIPDTISATEGAPTTLEATDTKIALTPEAPQTDPIVVPKGGTVKLTVKDDPSNVHGVTVQVHDKVLIDYIVEFFTRLYKKLFVRG